MAAGKSGSTDAVGNESAICSTVARSTGLRPTTAAGACSQRPMQGAPITRTPGQSACSHAARSASAPAIWQDSVSQTRTVSAGGGVSPSFTTSK